tara:strand:+ start:12762 stop:13676 length:915 start_codon:yes stop_codon:yes gene_type:complete
METRIIGFAGAKQSGKSTCSNFIHGYELSGRNVVDNWTLTDTGRLIVKTDVVEDGKESKSETFLDTSRKDEQFVEWAMFNMWPYVKKYSFADTLKEIAITLFGLSYEQVYGDDSYKNQRIPHLKWENMPGVMTPHEWSMRQGGVAAGYTQNPEEFNIKLEEGPMTAREFLQFLGTDVMRKIHDPVWVNRMIKDIKLEEPAIAVVDDVRFLNEIEAIQDAGGIVIGLNRCPFESVHSSEQVVKDHQDKFDYVIDNQELGIQETCVEVIKILERAGWLSEKSAQSETCASNVAYKTSAIHTIKEKE